MFFGGANSRQISSGGLNEGKKLCTFGYLFKKKGRNKVLAADLINSSPGIRGANFFLNKRVQTAREFLRFPLGPFIKSRPRPLYENQGISPVHVIIFASV